MQAKQLKRMSSAYQLGYQQGNDYRANAWIEGDNVQQTAATNAGLNFDSPDSRLDYQHGFCRACNVK